MSGDAASNPGHYVSYPHSLSKQESMSHYNFPLTTSQQLFNQQYLAACHRNQLSRNLVTEFGFNDVQDGRSGNREDTRTGYELYNQTAESATERNSRYNQEALIMTPDGHIGSGLYGQEVPGALRYGSEMTDWVDDETSHNVPGK